MPILLKYKRIIKYITAGGLVASVELSLLYFLTDFLGVWYLLSASITFTCAFFISFFLQKFWTFRDRDKEGMYKQITFYFVIAIVNLMINAAFMYILVDGFGVWYMLAQVISGGLIACESYLINKFFIFNKTSRSQTAEENKENVSKKILIATGIYPPDYRGPATMLKALPAALTSRGFEVKIITYSDFPAPADEPNRVYRVLRSRPAIWRYLKYFFKMYLLSGWSDLIYATDLYSVGYFSYLLKKFVGRKYIVRFAGDSAWETAVRLGWTNDNINDFQKKIYEEKIEKLKTRRKKIMMNADAVIAVSNFLAEVARELGVAPDKIQVIYNSVDFIKSNFDQKIVDEVRERYGREAKIIVSAGELNPWKGFDGLIKAMPRLIKEFSGQAHLLILGRGQEFDKLKNLAREQGLESNIHFLGKINHNEIMNYFRAADLFVLNTNYEGLSHTLLEVMKAGTAIITTNVGGNPEVISNNQDGVLVSYNNVSELSGAMIKVIKNKELAKKFTENARIKLERFSWSRGVEQTVELINKITSSAT